MNVFFSLLPAMMSVCLLNGCKERSGSAGEKESEPYQENTLKPTKDGTPAGVNGTVGPNGQTPQKQVPPLPPPPAPPGTGSRLDYTPSTNK